MEPYQSTTPFGRRTLTLAHVASQVVSRARPPEKAVHKWRVYQAICTAKGPLRVTERALAVLNALLTFHPETALTGDDLIVFPSNEQLARRAHGMPPSTLRRHISVLVDAGLVIRRDSPNGKRYARKGRNGAIEMAFGFDLGPLVARAEEFERLAEEVAAADRALKLARERITLCRRDIAKMIATGMEERVPTRRRGQGPADWAEVLAIYRGIFVRVPRSATVAELEPIAEELTMLAEEVRNLLEAHAKTSNPSANESRDERHIQNSNPDQSSESEPGFRESQGRSAAGEPEAKRSPQRPFPLSMVLQACPDFAMFARHGIASWRDFVSVAETVRGAFGISPSAWAEATDVMGAEEACVALAAIVQRSAMIKSPGGYLRNLTEKARAGKFSAWPMLMALWRLQLGRNKQS